MNMKCMCVCVIIDKRKDKRKMAVPERREGSGSYVLW